MHDAGSDAEDHARDPSQQHGFTLIELIAVLVVLAAIVALAGPRIARRDEAGAAQAIAQHVASRCRAARAAAIRRNLEQTVVVDLAQRTVVTDGTTPLRIPVTIDIHVDTSASEQNSPTATAIRFYANGSSSGGTVAFSAGSRTTRVRVNWFTGRVSIDAIP